ncbi:hypothetical protein CROQUDRAFT_92635 [Cronartium quercuum f. sp. fusiforme G11]|uniref:Uncharacterized protein n=1 Tax=Cronartium quercuum f. sp. fusiforme G11 TaxID=708437 RepID=A0A9P6NLT9_9BASI|nr:hypothetical protein CROQUDRAFT_92635 [Cronartium quercuum f. sp. fusiforme G11]
MSSRLDSKSVRGAFGVLLIKWRRRVIPLPSTHLPTRSRGTSTSRPQHSPSLGSVFTPPVPLVRSLWDNPSRRRSSLIPSNPFDPLISLDFPRFPSLPIQSTEQAS